MAVSSLNRVKTIAIPLTASNSSNILTIYQNPGISTNASLSISNVEVLSVNSFLKNLKVFAAVRSLPTAQFPEFKITDSETDKLMKTLDIEWGSPRKQLNLYISAGNEWFQVGSVSLLNPYGYPFRVYNLLDLFTDSLALELGDNARIGVSVQDVGHGLLTPEDQVVIHGSYIEEIIVRDKSLTTIINNIPDTLTISPPIINIYSESSFTGNLTPNQDNSVGKALNFGNNLLLGN